MFSPEMLCWFQVVSGDADLPLKGDLGERRRAEEQRQMNRKVQLEDLQGEEEDSDVVPEEDQVYRAAKEDRAARLAKKAEKYTHAVGNVPRQEEFVEGKRAINRDVGFVLSLFLRIHFSPFLLISKLIWDLFLYIFSLFAD